MSISLNTLKLHNDRLDELINRLEDNFGWKPIHPKEDVQTIMYRAGQASVIEYIKSSKERISKNVDLEKSYKKLSTMINSVKT